MYKLSIVLLTLFFFNTASTIGQTTYKKYSNNTYKVSFDIPNYWAIQFSKEQAGFICAPITTAEKTIYKDCFEGIVFRMFFYNSTLDSTLINDGYTKTGNTYFTTDRVNNQVKTENIKGSNWTGIYHNNICGISCKLKGVQGAGGHCQFIYFSNGKTTVCITTNGKELKDEILKRLKTSFRFN